MSENILRWYADYEDHTHGMSSECIARAYVMRNEFDCLPPHAISRIPLDSQDFWRCMKLCYIAPDESKIGLELLAKRSIKWKIILKYWDEIKSCYPNDDSILRITQPNKNFDICRKTLDKLLWHKSKDHGFLTPIKDESDIDWDKLPNSLLDEN